MNAEKLLTSKDLADRWRMAEGTIRTQRNNGSGPKYMKLGRIIRYSFFEIVDFETRSQKQSTAENYSRNSSVRNASNLLPAKSEILSNHCNCYDK